MQPDTHVADVVCYIHKQGQPFTLDTNDPRTIYTVHMQGRVQHHPCLIHHLLCTHTIQVETFACTKDLAKTLQWCLRSDWDSRQNLNIFLAKILKAFPTKNLETFPTKIWKLFRQFFFTFPITQRFAGNKSDVHC